MAAHDVGLCPSHSIVLISRAAVAPRTKVPQSQRDCIMSPRFRQDQAGPLIQTFGSKSSHVAAAHNGVLVSDQRKRTTGIGVCVGNRFVIQFHRVACLQRPAARRFHPTLTNLPRRIVSDAA